VQKGCKNAPFCTLVGCSEISAILSERMARTTRLELATSAVTAFTKTDTSSRMACMISSAVLWLEDLNTASSPFSPSKFPFAALGFGDSIRVGDEDVINLKLKCPGRKPGVCSDTYGHAHRLQAEQFGRSIRRTHDDGRIMARVHIFQYSRRRFIFRVEKRGEKVCG